VYGVATTAACACLKHVSNHVFQMLSHRTVYVESSEQYSNLYPSMPGRALHNIHNCAIGLSTFLVAAKWYHTPAMHYYAATLCFACISYTTPVVCPHPKWYQFDRFQVQLTGCAATFHLRGEGIMVSAQLASICIK
jgi:hypothetical protein